MKDLPLAHDIDSVIFGALDLTGSVLVQLGYPLFQLRVDKTPDLYVNEMHDREDMARTRYPRGEHKVQTGFQRFVRLEFVMILLLPGELQAFKDFTVDSSCVFRQNGGKSVEVQGI